LQNDIEEWGVLNMPIINVLYVRSISPEELNSCYDSPFITEGMFVKKGILFQKVTSDDIFYENHLSLLDAIDKPSPLFYGKYDPVCTEEQKQYYLKHSPKGKLVEFEHSSHFPRLEEERKYTKEVLKFLRKI
jgi:pimeloyl-ACP methyl ester carboxylesterase